MIKVKGCVLVVDDSSDMREALADLLRLENYCSILAANGKEALTKLEQVLPNLIVTDLTMPVLDGISFMEALDQNDLFENLPIILMTGSDIQATKTRLHNSGLSCHVVQKPLNLHDFMLLVDDAVTRNLTLRAPRPAPAQIDPLTPAARGDGNRKNKPSEGRKTR
jgi:two-component system chemotaxis response regulator CheY